MVDELGERDGINFLSGNCIWNDSKYLVNDTDTAFAEILSDVGLVKEKELGKQLTGEELKEMGVHSPS